MSVCSPGNPPIHVGDEMMQTKTTKKAEAEEVGYVEHKMSMMMMTMKMMVNCSEKKSLALALVLLLFLALVLVLTSMTVVR